MSISLFYFSMLFRCGCIDIDIVWFRCASTTESDYLEVTGLADGSSKRYCTTKDEPMPPALTATSDSVERSRLVLTFQSDGNYDATGFDAVYHYSTFMRGIYALIYLRSSIMKGLIIIIIQFL